MSTQQMFKFDDPSSTSHRSVTMATKEIIKSFEGEWQCDNSRTENFEEFLAEMGVNFMIRKLAKRSSPIMTISSDDTHITFKNEAGFTTKITSLPLDGTEVLEDHQGGGKSNTKFCAQDGKLIMTAIPVNPGMKKTVVTRELVGGELIQLIDVGDGKVVCKRVFKRKQ